MSVSPLIIVTVFPVIHHTFWSMHTLINNNTPFFHIHGIKYFRQSTIHSSENNDDVCVYISMQCIIILYITLSALLQCVFLPIPSQCFLLLKVCYSYFFHFHTHTFSLYLSRTAVPLEETPIQPRFPAVFRKLS